MTTTPTLDGLRAKRTALEERVTSLDELLRDPSREEVLPRLMRQYIKPRADDEQWTKWYTAQCDRRKSESDAPELVEAAYAGTRERLAKLETAIEQLDISSALKHGRLQKPDTSSGFYAKMLFLLIELSRELEGLTEALTWLDKAQEVAHDGDTEKMTHTLAMLGVSPCNACDCDKDIKEDFRHPSLAWLHGHHQEFNQSAWEIISSVPGLMVRMRAVLEADIRREETEIVERNFGREVVNHFLTPTPSSAWVHDTYVPIAA